MLAPTTVQRFVRQILIPEIGRPGQERWAESRLTITGAGPAPDAAVELIRAAGVAVELAPSVAPSGPMAPIPSVAPVASVHSIPSVHSKPTVAPARAPAELGNLWLADTAFADRRAACADCLAAFFGAQPAPPSDERAAVASAAGAAAAGEVLLQLLDTLRPPIAMVFTPEPRRATVAREHCACRK